MRYGATHLPMSELLSALLVRLRKEPSARASFRCPVLLWEAPAIAHGEHWEKTQGLVARAPVLGDPLVFRVEKRQESGNAFPVGVTIGRVDNNDLVLDDDSVSRFHAFLRFDDRDRSWVLTDAESRNGTWVDGQKLEPNQSAPLKDGSRLRFGDAVLEFFLPASFTEFLEFLEVHGGRT